MQSTNEGTSDTGVVISNYVLDEIERRITAAETRYGPFRSTHEALGVAMEEWDELREAVKSNDLPAVKRECADLAAVLIRLIDSIETNKEMRDRSSK